MFLPFQSYLCPRRPAIRCGVRLRVELLETRELLSAGPTSSLYPVFSETVGNNTLTTALQLGDLNQSGGAIARGTITNTPLGAGNVDWYTFSLSAPSAVVLNTQSDSTLSSILGLYNSDPFDFGDYYDPDFNRLLAQDNGKTNNGNAYLQRELAAGTYFVAVSGFGNQYFSPYLAGSGYAGNTGAYTLTVSASGLGFGSDDGPQVLETDPQPGAALTSSPFVIRVNFSTPIDPGTVSLGDNVLLTYNPDGNFGDGQDVSIPFAGFNLSTAGDELQLLPAAPLSPGYYQLDLESSLAALPNLDGVALPLGATSLSSQGQSYWMNFQVTGAEGQSSCPPISHDIPATAIPLGDVTNAGLIQVAGAIGDDPTDPIPFDPSSVEMYQFSISGVGKYAFSAEAFASRIDSPLDVALSLFEPDPVTGQLDLVTANDNTGNTIVGSNDSLPLFSDSALYAGLTAGQYYIAVSSSYNAPDPLEGLQPGVNGVFNPNVSQSGQDGSSTGPYVLNLAAQLAPAPPKVIAVSPSAQTILDAPPTEIQVQFSEPINLQQLAYLAYQPGAPTDIQAVFIVGPNGADYFPRLQSWDEATDSATFQMFDPLPNGNYQLHFSGPLGLTGLAGNSLVSNDPSGDYVVPFTVKGPARGSLDNPLLWVDQGGNNTAGKPQNLGTLFPDELQLGAGVAINRDASLPVAGSSDYYQFQVLQSRTYFFNLTGSGFAGDPVVTVFDAAGNPQPGAISDNGQILELVLTAGTYLMQVGNWSAGQTNPVSYQLAITLGGAQENPTPLTIGPAPVLSLRLSSQVPVPPAGVVPPMAPTSSASAAVAIPTDVLAGLGSGPLGGASGIPASAAPASGLAFFNGGNLPGSSQFASAGAGAVVLLPFGPVGEATIRHTAYLPPRSEPIVFSPGFPPETIQALPLPISELVPAAPQVTEMIIEPVPAAIHTLPPLPMAIPEHPPLTRLSMGIGQDPWVSTLMSLAGLALVIFADHNRSRGKPSQCQVTTSAP